MTCGLSRDVLKEVFKHLDLQDLLNVHVACRLFRELSDPLVYATVHLLWEDIDYISRTVASHDTDFRVQFIREAFIAPSGRGEWNSSHNLSLLVPASNFNLVRLCISCALRSSGWLKYVDFPLVSVTKLELVAAGPYVNYAFDFEHIAYNFPCVESISLGDSVAGFLIDASTQIVLPRLKHIKVENCEWQYPARLADAASKSRLEELEIYVTQHMHPFAFSERLQNEVATLPYTLQSLVIHLDVGKRISWNPLQKTKGLPNLTTARLHGFDYKYRSTEPTDSKFPRLAYLQET